MPRGRGLLTRCRPLCARRCSEERPEGLPPTPAGALTLGLRNFANEFRALASYVRGDRSDELKGMEDETARGGSARGAPAAT